MPVASNYGGAGYRRAVSLKNVVRLRDKGRCEWGGKRESLLWTICESGGLQFGCGGDPG